MVIIPRSCRSTVKRTLTGSADCISKGMRRIGIRKAVLVTMQTNSYGKLCVDILSVACGWWIKYTLNMLDVSDVIMDVVDLYVKHIKF